MPVTVAEKAGFCSGVKRALTELLEQVEKHGKGSTLGPLAHNEEVVSYLQERGVITVNEPSEAKGAFLAVRTHGLSPELCAELEKLEETVIIDLTCPRVKYIQELAAGLKAKGTSIVIFGDKEHAEVRGLSGWAGEQCIVVSSPHEMKYIDLSAPAALIAQTTANPELYADAGRVFLQRLKEGLIYDTLCPEIKLRQQEITKLAQRVEALVVVGSSSSANTKALFDSCRQLKPSCRVANARELDRSFLKQYRDFAVVAGASTPPWTIKEVVESMENEHLEVKQEEQFEFTGEVKVPQVGEMVTGKVARVADEEVYVDIGAKTEAILPISEVHRDEDKTLGDYFSPEDDIEVTVLDIEEQEGKVIVSHKRLAKEKRLQELEENLENETILEGKVKQVVPAGIVVDLGSGVEGFMPGSLVDTKYIPDFNEFKDQLIQFIIIEYDRDKGKLILSRRKVIEAETAKKREETLNALEVGSTISGVVKRLTDFGAFVDVGGIDGLVHISELSWERIGHPKEVLKVGDQIDVKVLEVIAEKERISLSIRKTQPDPWTKAVEELESEQLINGKVTRLVNFGAFIEIKPGVEGLAHISQLADYHVNHPSEILTEGEEVEVKILEVKPKAKRISLSLKDARGVAVAPDSGDINGAENGNVTIGDVFGDLFEGEEYDSLPAASAAAAEEEEEVVGAEEEEVVVSVEKEEEEVEVEVAAPEPAELEVIEQNTDNPEPADDEENEAEGDRD